MSDINDGLDRMFDLVHGMAENLEEGYALGSALRINAPPEGDALLLCGMGGSAIAGDLLSPLVSRAGHRLDVWRDYGLPGWVDARTTVLLSSYSGNTEEVLSTVSAARERGCPRFALTTGGALGDLADGRGDPGFPAVRLPGGLPPRASLGFGLGAQAALLQTLGALPGMDGEIAAAASTLRDGRMTPGHGRSGTAATASDPDAPGPLAAAIDGRHVVIYTTSAESHPAGMRLKAQLNENAKRPASVARFPELDHNDIVGWELDDRRREDYVLLVLRSDDEMPAVDRRVSITLDLLSGQFGHIAQIPSRGDRALARIMSLVQFGDFLSCHLAAVRGVDPCPVDRIDALKSRLGGRPLESPPPPRDGPSFPSGGPADSGR